ncbi:HepT-like ribonuclease domain-containing protein, partial [Desulfonatronovibrio magnus]
MSKRSEKAYLLDIQEAIKRTLSYISGLDYSLFARDYKTQDAVIRNLEIIGEA